jgi:hypothetical protein
MQAEEAEGVPAIAGNHGIRLRLAVSDRRMDAAAATGFPLPLPLASALDHDGVAI